MPLLRDSDLLCLQFLFEYVLLITICVAVTIDVLKLALSDQNSNVRRQSINGNSD